MKAQEAIKKELVVLFPTEDFSWISDLFPKTRKKRKMKLSMVYRAFLLKL